MTLTSFIRKLIAIIEQILRLLNRNSSETEDDSQKTAGTLRKS